MADGQERRKSSKPLMEKRRRARINECLTELQGILDVINGRTEANGSHSKREKAEILEQTVQLVKQLRYQDQPGPSTESVPQAQYRAGFNECLAQVGRFMEANQTALNVDTRTGLLNHLASTLHTSSSSSGGGGVFNGYSALTPPAAASAVGYAHPSAGGGESKAADGTALSRRPVLARRPVINSSSSSSNTIATSAPASSSQPPPRASVPPLPPPPTPAPSVDRPQTAGRADSLPVQQSPRKAEQPTAAATGNRPAPSPALPAASAGHVALVLPAQLLSSLVGGQLTTGQVIPLYHHQQQLPQQQGGGPVVGAGQPAPAGTSVLLPAGSAVAGGGYTVATAAPADVPKTSGLVSSAASVVSINASAAAAGGSGGQVILVSSGHPGLGFPAGAVPAYSVLGGLPAVSARRDAAEPSPPTAPSTAAADATRRPLVNGVVCAPASVPMNLYVPAAGGNGPFANGLPLPNPPSLALSSHWRPWGWEQDQR